MGYQEEKQRQLDIRYLKMARIWAENSYCVRRKVGALIVKDKMIISDGYNGTPSGFENICEDEDNRTKAYVLHAEANAITKVAKSANNCDGSTLYITAAPCIECSKLIIQAGIKRVVYAEEYRSEEGINLLNQKEARVYAQSNPAEQALRLGTAVDLMLTLDLDRVKQVRAEAEKLAREAAEERLRLEKEQADSLARVALEGAVVPVEGEQTEENEEEFFE